MRTGKYSFTKKHWIQWKIIYLHSYCSRVYSRWLFNLCLKGNDVVFFRSSGRLFHSLLPLYLIILFQFHTSQHTCGSRSFAKYHDSGVSLICFLRNRWHLMSMEQGADCLHYCIWSTWCCCILKTTSSLASFKSRLVLPFGYWLTQVVLEKRQLNGCSISTIRYKMLF